MIRKLFFTLMVFVISSFSAEINVFAVGGLAPVFDEQIKEYKQKYPQGDIKISYASVGKGYAQVMSGAPYDIFFSADTDYPEKLYKEGFAISKPTVFAVGKLVIWTRKDSGIAINNGVEVVLNPKVKKISIANPDLAVYGKAAVDCLKHYNLYEKVRDKLILAENINQAGNYAYTGSAEIGFVSLSVAKSKAFEKEGNYVFAPNNCYEPVKHAFVILNRAKENPNKFEEVKRFVNFILQPSSKEIFKKYGFEVE